MEEVVVVLFLTRLLLLLVPPKLSLRLLHDNSRQLLYGAEMEINFDLVSYVSRLVKLRKSGAYFIGPCPICGGRDRFTIKRAEADLWICRKCTMDGKYHSAIDFIMQYHRVDFKEAVKRMGGELPERRQLGKPQRSVPAPVQVLPSRDWQVKAWKRIDAASNRLVADEVNPGWQYLTERGISRGAIYMNLLGYDPAKYDKSTNSNRPAIVVPWLDMGETVTAVKYRFIDELARADKNRRFIALSGSMPYLFGLQHVLTSDETLLFVEGELNAISILQTLPRGVSVVSAGSEGNGNAAILRALAGHYARVIVWTDDPAKGQEIRERMHRGDARLLKSPMIDGKKWDANQMLQAGLLMDFLTRQLAKECLGVPVLQAAEAEV